MDQKGRYLGFPVLPGERTGMVGAGILDREVVVVVKSDKGNGP